MSMRAVERFIKEQMNGDSKSALAILEQSTGKKLKIKSAGRPQVDPSSEYFWYLYLWNRIQDKNRNLEDELDALIPVNTFHNKGQKKEVIINRDRYYKWNKENKEYLTLKNYVTRGNLELIYDDIYRLMEDMERQ